MAVIAQLVARRSCNPKVAKSIVNHRMFLNVRRLILRLSISYRDHYFSFHPKKSRSVAVERLLFPPATRKTRAQFPAAEYSPLQAIGPPRLTAALSQSRRSELLQCQPTSCRRVIKGVWRNGSASDSRSEGWEFASLGPHFAPDAHHSRKSRG